MKLCLRALVLTVLRFVALLILLIFVLNFDVSPLPEWTLVAFVYLMDFSITYLFARWTFRQQRVAWGGVAVVAVIFVLFQMVLEAGMKYFISPNTALDELLSGYSWQSLIVIGVYVLAVLLAGWQKINKSHRNVMAEGIAL